MNGSLYMLPLQRSAPGLVLLRNASIYDKIIGPDYTPTNADDFKRAMMQLNRPQENRWATGNVGANDGLFGLGCYAEMFNAPNRWKLDSAGNEVEPAA